MKIDFTPKDFLRLFKLAAGVASTKYITPILQNVKIVADKQNGAILMATNLEIGIRVRLDVHVSESGEALLPVKTLRTILDSTKESTLTMERTQDGKVVVYGANERHELCTQDPDAFPNVEEFDASDYFELGVDNAQTLLNRTIFAVDNKDGRPAMQGVCFEDDTKSIIAVATDGRRMAIQEIPRDHCEKPTIAKYDDKGNLQRLAVPTSALKLLDKVLKDKVFKTSKKHVLPSVVKMAFAENRVMFHCESTNGNENITIFSRLCKGQFPKWRDIVPTKETPMAYAKVESQDLLTAVKTAQATTNNLDPGIYVTFENGKMELTGNGKERGNGKTTIAAECRGMATFKIDPKFLTEMLKTLDKGSYITIGCNGDDPLLIETDGGKFTYVVLPMHDGEKAPSPNQAWDENGKDITAFLKEKQERENQEALERIRQEITEKSKLDEDDDDLDSEESDDEESDEESQSDMPITTEENNDELDEVFVNGEWMPKTECELCLTCGEWKPSTEFDNEGTCNDCFLYEEPESLPSTIQATVVPIKFPEAPVKKKQTAFQWT